MSLKRKREDDDGIAEKNRIDADGDVILLVSAYNPSKSLPRDAKSTEKFLVSSKVLSVASSYWKQFFQSKIGQNGSQNGSLAEIHLEDKSFTTVRAVLARLHFGHVREKYGVSGVKELEEFAQLCRTWKCTEALSILMRCWIESLMFSDEDMAVGGETEYFKSLAIIAELFDDQRLFQAIILRAARMLNKAQGEEFWMLFATDKDGTEEKHEGIVETST